MKKKSSIIDKIGVPYLQPRMEFNALDVKQNHSPEIKIINNKKLKLKIQNIFKFQTAAHLISHIPL